MSLPLSSAMGRSSLKLTQPASGSETRTRNLPSISSHSTARQRAPAGSTPTFSESSAADLRTMAPRPPCTSYSTPSSMGASSRLIAAAGRGGRGAPSRRCVGERWAASRCVLGGNCRHKLAVHNSDRRRSRNSYSRILRPASRQRLSPPRPLRPRAAGGSRGAHRRKGQPHSKTMSKGGDRSMLGRAKTLGRRVSLSFKALGLGSAVPDECKDPGLEAARAGFGRPAPRGHPLRFEASFSTTLPRRASRESREKAPRPRRSRIGGHPAQSIPAQAS